MVALRTALPEVQVFNPAAAVRAEVTLAVAEGRALRDPAVAVVAVLAGVMAA
jgi:hypothetical protein